MILAAGRGKRLRPLTDAIPKALVTVRGVTLLESVLQRLKYFGFDEVIINVHHLAGQIISFLEEHDNFGLHVYISDESACLLDTGGALKKIRSLVDDNRPLLIHNVDIISDIDLAKLYDDHLHSQSLVSLAVRERESSRVFLFDDTYNLRGWRHKVTGEVKPAGLAISSYKERAFSGIQVVGPHFFEECLRSYCFPVDEDVFSVIDVYLCLAAHHSVRGYDHSHTVWYDVGKAGELRRAEANDDIANLFLT
jgi:NDP-sugar pyrophosphorylase family protein